MFWCPKVDKVTAMTRRIVSVTAFVISLLIGATTVSYSANPDIDYNCENPAHCKPAIEVNKGKTMIRLWCYNTRMVDGVAGTGGQGDDRTFKYKCGHAGCVKARDHTSSCLCNLTKHATLYNLEMSNCCVSPNAPKAYKC